MELGIGTRLTHPKYGNGVIIDVDAHIYTIYFADKGEVEISKSFEGMVIVKEVINNPDHISWEEVQKTIKKIIAPLTDPVEKVEIADKWIGGTITLNPGKKDVLGKEIPINTFFNKIIMIRDRMRVLEQKINSSNLSDSEKIDIQQYITRSYGSLTTFNVLFRFKEDYFKGTGNEG
jgi:hypothetical protein